MGREANEQAKRHRSVLEHAAGAFKSIPGIDVDCRPLADLDVDDRHQPSLDQMARAGIAFELRHLAEERARQDHGIAALAVMGGAHDRLSARLAERGDEAVEIGGRHGRHVAEHDQRAGRIVRNGSHAGFERA